MTRWPRPLLISSDRGGQLLQATPVGTSRLSEAELQDLLQHYPQLLPVGQFDPLFDSPICIGREVATGAGPVDLLYISPYGYLTLVETKLWKSPEARRQVVAQIIDYTRHIVRWSYSDLDAAFARYAEQRRIEQRSLAAYVADQSDETLDEAEFVDAVARCLRHGRVLLLIVGDGIRESVEEMTAYLQETPNLQFTLGLIEAACYVVANDGEKPSTLIVPRVVTRTAEVTRAIVQIEMSEEAARQVTVTTKTPRVADRRVSDTLSKIEFYELLAKSVGSEAAHETRRLIDGLIETHDVLDEYFTKWKLVVRAELPTLDLRIPILHFGWSGGAGVDRWLARKVTGRGIPGEVVEQFLRGLHQIDSKFPDRTAPDGSIPGFKTLEKNASLRNVLPKFGEVERLLLQLLQDIERHAQSES